MMIKSAFKENRIAIFISIAILFSSLLLGYLLQPALDTFLNPVVDKLTQDVQNGTIQLTFHDIFLNNIQIVFLMFVLGAIFCFSAVVLGFNGLFVGYYVACCDNLGQALALIIPHGIFEFSSCILACSSGFVLFNFLVKFIKSFLSQNDSFSERLLISFSDNSYKLLQAFVLLIVSSVLMIIAGIIEVYFTVPIAEFFTF